jgi:tellurite resistance protein TehA-like permease
MSSGTRAEVAVMSALREHPVPARSLLPDLQRPADLFAHVGPNWYASIMGTGIVATAAATLPLAAPTLRTPATVVWALAGSAALQGLALGLYALLVAAWITVAVRTSHGSIRGNLFLPATPPPVSTAP